MSLNYKYCSITNLFVSVCNILSSFETMFQLRNAILCQFVTFCLRLKQCFIVKKHEKKKRSHHEGKSKSYHLIKIIVPIQIFLFHFLTFCLVLEQLFRNMYRTISAFCTISWTSIDLQISCRERRYGWIYQKQRRMIYLEIVFVRSFFQESLPMKWILFTAQINFI